ncbi:unnamed protein product [Spirodela intermedia]|uniref:Uncharacterized protein n=1 Tax=Spirodela intermedia TaxID=51605 RepID=A0A7I8IAE2_SPIIN|nr:unnamed protein product [Spirodela intermedia]CAA6654434.1 unnamed protein product [Spirodela intermedia]
MGSRKAGVGVQDDREVASRMSSLVPPLAVSPATGAEGKNMPPSQVPDFGARERSLGFGLQHPGNLSRDIFNLKFSGQTVASNSLRYDAVGKALSSPDATPSDSRSESLPSSQQKAAQNFPSLPSGHFENWGDSAVAAETSPRTDTSTDVDTDEKSQGKNAMVAVSDSSDRSKEKPGDQKTLRRLAQNREAARKSRLRKKAYVQQLESSRLKLNQLEQELQRARQQGIFISSSGDQSHPSNGNGALTFDVEYARWLEEHNRQIGDLRTAVNAHASDNDLRSILDSVMAHYDDIFRLKSIAAKADVFHILSGMWKTPAERCFLWLGGFRSSELLKLLVSHLEPLTEQQMAGICNLQQTSLQQSLSETLASGSLGTAGSSGNVANYMGQMAMAMGKLGTLENFLRQADNLRQQTLQQMHRTLTIRQSARAHLAINDYFSRLRALSSLWLARPESEARGAQSAPFC